MKKGRKKAGLHRESIFCYVFVGGMALISILPLWMIFATSISDESEIVRNGFSILPQSPGLDTYRFIICQKGRMLLRAFGVTFAVVIAGTFYTLFVTTAYSYAIAQPKRKFRFAGILSFFAWFTTVFSGGILPWYILTTKYYRLQNNLWALFIPYGMNVFFMFILRNNFKAIPEELIEAAEMDGASQARIFTSISLPLSKVGITIILFTTLQYWNDFHLSLYLITATDLYTVQKLLYNMMANISALLSGAQGLAATQHITIPSNTARMAMTIFTVAPIMVFYPFAQKYFVKGMMVGGVKG